MYWVGGGRTSSLIASAVSGISASGALLMMSAGTASAARARVESVKTSSSALRVSTSGSGIGGAITCGAVEVGAGVSGGVLCAPLPGASDRASRERRRAEAREAWPRMIEEMRLLTASLGRSIPQALFDVGRRAPAEMRPAFQAAEREWLITTDFARTVAVLKARLADPTADATCETLLVAYEVGGSELDRRLAALADDRTIDLQGRKDARAKQAGVRFARRFVLVVPLGMALAGLSIGTGRHAYQTALGQLLVASGLAFIAACWAWAGHLMRLPEEERVFHGEA